MDRRGKQKLRSQQQESGRQLQSSAPSIRAGVGFTQIELTDGEVALLTGTARIQVLEGVLEVNGFLLRPSSDALVVSADAPTSGALTMRAAAPQAVAPLAATARALAVVSPLEAAGGAGNAPGAEEAQPGYQVVMQGAQGVPSAWQQPEWREAVHSIAAVSAAAAATPGAPPCVIAVCGSKGTGKSTLGRLMVNRLLSQHRRVAYLDTDCGQPEFTPPGVLSLHLLDTPVFGAPHTHMRTPELAYFQGDVSSQSDPARYLQAVLALHAWYCAHAGSSGGDAGNDAGPVWPPLVINMHGWITGLGFDLLVEMLRGIGPTHVVKLQTSNAKKNLPSGHFWLDQEEAATGQLLHVPAIAGPAAPAASGLEGASYVSRQSSLGSGDAGTARSGGRGSAVVPVVGAGQGKAGAGAVEARALQWLAWAQHVVASSPSSSAQLRPQLQGAGDADDFSAAAEGLAACVPYEVAAADVRLQVLQCSVPPRELAAAVNGAVVGLAVQPEAGGSGAGLQACLGVGLIRAVDAAAGKLYLLTDAPGPRLDRVGSLQVGRLELPLALTQTAQLAPPYQQLFCLAAAATGAGVIKSRNNLLRAGLLGQ